MQPTEMSQMNVSFPTCSYCDGTAEAKVIINNKAACMPCFDSYTQEKMDSVKAEPREGESARSARRREERRWRKKKLF